MEDGIRGCNLLLVSRIFLLSQLAGDDVKTATEVDTESPATCYCKPTPRIGVANQLWRMKLDMSTPRSDFLSFLRAWTASMLHTRFDFDFYGNIVCFGFGVKHVITDLAETEQGLTLVALCTASHRHMICLWSASAQRIMWSL